MFGSAIIGLLRLSVNLMQLPKDNFPKSEVVFAVLSGLQRVIFTYNNCKNDYCSCPSPKPEKIAKSAKIDAKKKKLLTLV
jgi:hypothetical protein